MVESMLSFKIRPPTRLRRYSTGLTSQPMESCGATPSLSQLGDSLDSLLVTGPLSTFVISCTRAAIRYRISACVDSVLA
jgi:hypothetical protein